MQPVVILSGSAHPALAGALARRLGLAGGAAALSVERFPDGEIRVEAGGVRGRAVFLVQTLVAPVGDGLLELLLAADACRRAGAASVSAAIPYLAYARQDRRTREGEPLGARVVADVVSTGGFDRVLVVDLHVPAVEGLFRAPVEQLTAVPLLAEALARTAGGEAPAPAVLVAPDLGAVKLAHRYAARLGLPVAIVHKTRQTGADVTVESVVGDVRGLRPILVDDMVATAGTVAEAARAVIAAGALPDVTVAATHGLFVGPAGARLRALPINRIVVADTLPRHAGWPPAVETVPIDSLLADAVERIAAGRPLADLLACH
jgi:ribose-phosphate pyrophosphokinase